MLYMFLFYFVFISLPTNKNLGQSNRLLAFQQFPPSTVVTALKLPSKALSLTAPWCQVPALSECLLSTHFVLGASVN